MEKMPIRGWKATTPDTWTRELDGAQVRRVRGTWQVWNPEGNLVARFERGGLILFSTAFEACWAVDDGDFEYGELRLKAAPQAPSAVSNGVPTRQPSAAQPANA